mgnify:CR=1 FL=1
MNNNRLSKGTIIGYGIAGIGNNVAASLFYTYFIFFLTTIAGIKPAVAGLISSIAVLWDGINDPMIGYWSDNCKSKYGRRRPFQITGMIPLAIIIVGMFINPSFSTVGKSAYYIIINILFWFVFTWVDVPTISLADALDGSYEDKAKARTAWTVCVTIAGLLAVDLPPIFVEYMEKNGASAEYAWFMMAVIGAIITLLAYFISWNATRGKEIIPAANVGEASDSKHSGFIKQYIQAFKNKSMIFACIGVLLLYCASSGSVLASMNYLLQFNLALDGTKTSIYLFIFSVSQILGSFVLGVIFAHFDKKIGGRAREMGYINIFAGVFFLLMYFFGGDAVGVIITFFVEGFLSACFWLHGWDLAIDASKIELYKTGADYSCEYTAFIGFAFKLGGALGMWLVGMCLQLFGFDGEAVVQSASALEGVRFVFYIISGLFLVAAGIVFLKSPLTRNKLDAVIEGIEKKNKGESVDESVFADLL